MSTTLRHHPRRVPHAGDVLQIFPPDDFPLHFYRSRRPDLQIRADENDADAVRSARLFWSTVTGLSEEPSAVPFRCVGSALRGERSDGEKQKARPH